MPRVLSSLASGLSATANLEVPPAEPRFNPPPPPRTALLPLWWPLWNSPLPPSLPLSSCPSVWPRLTTLHQPHSREKLIWPY